jgi:hypothetical protein
MDNGITDNIEKLAQSYSLQLKIKMNERGVEMEADNNSHYLIYSVLGINTEEGKQIDLYQNKGRFLYKYAGSFLEEVTILCFEYKFKEALKKVKIENKIGLKPKTFEIDCLVGKKAYEIKWRDATTDGDHITKEHTRLQSVKAFGYKPIRIMFYYPNRVQAKRIQETLQTIYHGVDLKQILEKIAQKNSSTNIKNN